MSANRFYSCPRVLLSQLQREPYAQPLSEARRRHAGAPGTVVRGGALRLAAGGNGSGATRLLVDIYYDENQTKAHLLSTANNDDTVLLVLGLHSPSPRSPQTRFARGGQ